MDDSESEDGIEIDFRFKSDLCTVIMEPDETVHEIKRRLAGAICASLCLAQCTLCDPNIAVKLSLLMAVTLPCRMDAMPSTNVWQCTSTRRPTAG